MRIKLIFLFLTLFAATASSNPIAHWKLNDNAANTTVIEEIGDFTGTASTNTSNLATTGKINGGLLLNGTTDYITISDASPLWAKDTNNPLLTNALFGSVWLENGTYHYYYVQSYATNYGANHATSNDGITWVIDEANNPVLSRGETGEWDAWGIEVVKVFKDGGIWYMLYRGRSAPPSTYAIGLARSNDGITWTKEPSNPVLTGTPGEWDGHTSAVFDPWGVIKVGSTYYLWYNANNATTGRTTGLATSTDLVNWTKDPRNPIFIFNRFCADVFKYEGYYYILICYRQNAVKRIELYRCPNPTFYPEEREYLGYVIGGGAAGSYDDYYLDTPCVVTNDVNRDSFPDDPVKCYYSGEKQATYAWTFDLAIFNVSCLPEYPPQKLSSSPNGFTICFWVKVVSPTNKDWLITKQGVSAGYVYSTYAFEFDSDYLNFIVGDGVSFTLHNIVPKAALTNNWTFICAGWDKVNRRIFSSVNAGDTTTKDFTFGLDPYIHSFPVVLGAGYGGTASFNGTLDNVMIFDHVLSKNEIEWLYNDGNGTEILWTNEPNRVVAWGWNDYDQSNVPLPNKGFVAVSGGYMHSLGLKQDGSIVAWGGNGCGQCNVPEPNTGFIVVAAGSYHNLGLKSDGSIVAWGDNSWGQCTVPEPNTGFVAVAGGEYHSLALKSDGSIVAWGHNGWGQCTVPEPNTGFVAVAAGAYHSLGLKSDGSVVAWGDNNWGQCTVPEPNTGFVAVAAGEFHSLGLKSDGSIVAWGANWLGQCDVPLPNTSFVAVAAGAGHSLGLKSDGSIAAWGWNNYGQCNVPLPNTYFAAMAAGYGHSLAIVEPEILPASGNVDYDAVYQQLEGFGGAAVYDVPNLVVHPKKEEIYDLLFKELGIEILRIRNCYGYDNNSVAATGTVVAEAREPQRSPDLELEMVPWSPPGYLKSSGTHNGGTLAKSDGNYVYDDYANWWYDSLLAWKANGVKPDLISIQNKPDYNDANYDTCRFDPVENAGIAGYDQAFEHVWQKLNAEMGPNMPKVWAPCTSGFGDSVTYIGALIDVNHVDGFSHHLYTDGSYDNPDGMIPGMQAYKVAYGYKPLHMTEYAKTGTIPNLDMGLKFAWHIYNCLYYEGVTSFFNGALFRGPTSLSGIVTFDYTDYIIRPQYWFLKAYTRFTGKDWFVLGTSVNGSGSDNLRMSAFKDPNNSRLTVVILNKSNATDVNLSLSLSGFSPTNTEVYRSSQTEHWLYLGMFRPSQPLLLPRQSITTIYSAVLADCNEALAAGFGLTSDINGDCYVNYKELETIVAYWLSTGCEGLDNCEGADFEPTDGEVDLFDFSKFAQQWMWCNNPEDPNCM